MTEQVRPQRDELSALLDEELSAIEEADLRSRLAEDVGLRLELHAASHAREAVRSLGLVDVPEGALERSSNVLPMRPPRRLARRRALAGSVAAAVAAWLFLVVTVAPTPASADPVVGGSLDAHRASIENFRSSTKEVQNPLFPSRMGNDLTLQFVSLHGEQVHALYASPTQYVSVFQQPGVLDWEKLPRGGSLLNVDGLQAWTWDESDLRVVVLERDNAVFTFVSANEANSPDETTEMSVSALPEIPGPSLWSRITGACHDVARLFAFS